MHWEVFERKFKWPDRGKCCPGIYLEKLGKTTTPLVRIADDLVKTKTKHLLNTSLECYPTPIESVDTVDSTIVCCGHSSDSSGGVETHSA
jgi:hypothetical protein